VVVAAALVRWVVGAVVLAARTTEVDPAASVVLEKPTTGRVRVVLSEEM
jgi:hypothetical protein